MKEKRLTFRLERETKNTYRYEEESEGGMPPIMRTIYLQKWFTGNPPPEKIVVIIKPA